MWNELEIYNVVMHDPRRREANAPRKLHSKPHFSGGFQLKHFCWKKTFNQTVSPMVTLTPVSKLFQGYVELPGNRTQIIECWSFLRSSQTSQCSIRFALLPHYLARAINLLWPDGLSKPISAAPAQHGQERGRCAGNQWLGVVCSSWFWTRFPWHCKKLVPCHP